MYCQGNFRCLKCEKILRDFLPSLGKSGVNNQLKGTEAVVICITTLSLQGQKIFTVAQNHSHYLFEWNRKLKTAVNYRMLFIYTENLSLFSQASKMHASRHPDLIFFGCVPAL